MAISPVGLTPEKDCAGEARQQLTRPLVRESLTSTNNNNNNNNNSVALVR
jgi:hypothetical protein